MATFKLEDNTLVLHFSESEKATLESTKLIMKRLQVSANKLANDGYIEADDVKRDASKALNTIRRLVG